MVPINLIEIIFAEKTLSFCFRFVKLWETMIFSKFSTLYILPIRQSQLQIGADGDRVLNTTR